MSTPNTEYSIPQIEVSQDKDVYFDSATTRQEVDQAYFDREFDEIVEHNFGSEFAEIIRVLDLGEDIGQARAEITDSPMVQESGILKATSNILKGLIGW